MKKNIRLFEEFSRPDELNGLTLVKKLSTNDFMNMVKDRKFEDKNFVYRLINYVPNEKNLKWIYSGEIAIPIKLDDTKSVSVKETNMYKSPFMIFPKPLKIKKSYFFKNEDGNIERYHGTSKKKMENMTVKDVIVFSGISISAFLGNRGIGTTASEMMKLSSLLEDVFDNEKRHESWVKSSRNYLGYNFDEVYVYRIDDSDDAAETIISECEATIF